MVSEDRIIEAILKGHSQRRISKELGVGRARVNKILKKMRANPKYELMLPVLDPHMKTKGRGAGKNSFTVSGKEGLACLTSTVPITEDELSKRFHIDTEKWELVEFRVRTWETSRAGRKADLVFDEGKITGTVKDEGKMHKCPMYSATGKYVIKKEHNDALLAKAFRESLGEPIKRAVQKPISTSEDIVEIALPDVHVGLRSLEEETGEDYNLDICRQTVFTLLTQLTENMRQNPVSKIVLPIGNDWLNSDNANNTTASGTPQDEVGHWFKTFQFATKLAVDVVDFCRQMCSEVEVLLIPGNHDKERSYYLGECLKYAFSKESDVIIDCAISPVKVRLYHDTLVGYHHGDRVKISELAASMPVRWPALWAKSRWREWHMGHIHQEKEQDIAGVRVRHFRCITAPSGWTIKSGYTGALRASTSIRYRRGRGPFEVLYAFV